MNIDFAFYMKLFWRRLPVMMLFILICSTVGTITALKLPETWSTTARLLVEAPQIPESMVNSTVQTDAIEQLDIIQQKLMTRANLIDIANKFNVFENQRDMEPDEVVDQMQTATLIQRTAGRDQATLMTIGFTARSPQIAADVVNEYVTLVLQANAEFRMSRAENTLEFFEQEAQRLGEELDEQSTNIAVFKSDHANALPEDQSYRLGRQTLLQERLARLERERSAALAQREELVRIYEATGSVRQGLRDQRRRTPEEEQLIMERAELEQAKTVYSETNPRVIRRQAVVDRLEAAVAAQQSNGVETGQGEQISPEKAILEATLSEIDTRLKFLDTDITDTQTEIDELQRAIAESSANGIELAALERGYENIQTRYNAAVNNLNEARMSERIETTAQGQRISVIENANVPRLPTGPNRFKIIVLSVAMGLGLAGGYFLLLELLNRTIRRPSEMIGRFNITPITTIPYMESYSRRLMRRGGIVLATLVVLIGVPLGLWYIDTNYLPLELVVQKGLGKLGLG